MRLSSAAKCFIITVGLSLRHEGALVKISIQQLRYILKIAETGSLAEAARQLSTSKGTLSQALSQVEKSVGFAVFEGSRKGMKATDSGSELLDSARRVVREMDELERRFDIEARHFSSDHRFVVSMTPLGFALGALEDTAWEHVDEPIDLYASISHASQIMRGVHDGKVDMGIVHISHGNGEAMMQMVQDEDLEFHRLFDAPFVVYVSPVHPLAERSSVSYGELGLYPTFGLEQYLYLGLSEARSILVTGKEEDHAGLYLDFFAPARSLLSNFVKIDGCLMYCNLSNDRMALEELLKMPLAIPVETDERMHLGYIVRKGHQLRPIEQSYIEHLKSFAPAL